MSVLVVYNFKKVKNWVVKIMMDTGAFERKLLVGTIL